MNELAQAADDLNGMIALAEEVLANYKLGVRARVWLDNDQKTTLIFGKHKMWWRLLVEDGSGIEPLVNASLEVRLLAVERLPALTEAMLSEAESQVVKVRKATAALKEMVETLRGGK
jgi:hypothetical protein